jgi:hypothetical protein
MVASRWPQRLPFAASVRRATSASVRYSRLRRLALERRLGVTVRFLVVGATSLRCDLAMTFNALEVMTVRIKAKKEQHERRRQNSCRATVILRHMPRLNRPGAAQCVGCPTLWSTARFAAVDLQGLNSSLAFVAATTDHSRCRGTRRAPTPSAPPPRDRGALCKECIRRRQLGSAISHKLLNRR